MASLPYMQFNVSDYLADTQHLEPEEHGAYLLLIFNYWQTGKPLKNDDKKLSRIARCSDEQWLNIRSTIVEFFQNKDDVLFHKRVEEDLGRIRAKSKKASKAGKISAEKRKQNQDIDNNCSTPVDKVCNQKEKEKEKEKEKKIKYVCKPIANQLKKIIEDNKKIKINSQKINSWSLEIYKLINIDGVDPERIGFSLSWYEKNIGGEFVPVIESGKALREKFLKLESAAERGKKQQWHINYTPEDAIKINEIQKLIKMKDAAPLELIDKYCKGDDNWFETTARLNRIIKEIKDSYKQRGK